jgi:hypothetical protein
MRCKICGKPTNRAVRITGLETGTEIRIQCCEACRELMLAELKARQPVAANTRQG